MAQGDTPVTPQARRWAKTDLRLKEKLAAMATDANAKLAVAELARRTGVGRNVIYTHHASVLTELRRLRSERAKDVRAKGHGDRQNASVQQMHAKCVEAATQNAVLLRRALDAEARAERAEMRNAQLVKEVARLSKPHPIRDADS